MAIQSPLIFCLLAIAGLLAHSEGAKPRHYSTPFNRSSFPASFVFGAGSAAYQSEGAAHEDGRGPSIWDTFTRTHPEKISDQSTGDVADDLYHLYKGDVALMKKIGLDAFRFSISWSRILPRGKISGGVNPLGIKFYNNLINELLSKGLQPYVTLFHWDLPQALEDEYGGFLSPKVVNDYRDYVDLCFKEFGDRVKHWFTLNEPYSYSVNGYVTGTFAPGRCSNYIGNCTSGNSGTEPYVVAHNLLLSHATAVKLYKEKYQAFQKGLIGVTLVTHWIVPFSQTIANRKAAARGLDFMFGWFIHPITYGDYPQTMRSLVGNRLPKFSEAQSKMLKKSYDFLGVNYYSAIYAINSLTSNSVNLSYSTDNQATLTQTKNGIPIGVPTDLSWLYIYPRGIRNLMMYIKRYYGNPPLYITENGMATATNSTLPLKDALKDKFRISYHWSHLSYLSKAIKEGANVKGYFAWSFLDDFEWDAGYAYRFGLAYVDFKNGLKRYPKQSALWLSKFLQKGKVTH